MLPRAAPGPSTGVPDRGRREPPVGWPGALARCSPEGIRTLATAVRGRRPGPLDDGAVRWCGWCVRRWCFLAGVPGLEPRLTEPETVGLPITPYPKAWPAPRGAGYDHTRCPRRGCHHPRV